MLCLLVEVNKLDSKFLHIFRQKSTFLAHKRVSLPLSLLSFLPLNSRSNSFNVVLCLDPFYSYKLSRSREDFQSH